MHCFTSENQTYTSTWPFGDESCKSLKGQENLLLKNLQVKTRVENVRFLSWRVFFVGKYGIQSTNEMAFKKTVIVHASFPFPAIRFDAPTLLSFSGFTHAHAKCPPAVLNRTVVVDSDWRFNNLCGSHLLIQSELYHFVTINNSPIQDYVHPDDQTQPTFEMTPGFKPFTLLYELFKKKMMFILNSMANFFLAALHF